MRGSGLRNFNRSRQKGEEGCPLQERRAEEGIRKRRRKKDEKCVGRNVGGEEEGLLCVPVKPSHKGKVGRWVGGLGGGGSFRKAHSPRLSSVHVNGLLL